MRRAITRGAMAAVLVLGMGAAAPEARADVTITIDATALTSPQFDLSSQPAKLSTAVAHMLSLPTGTQVFRDDRGNAFVFTVDVGGTISYDPGFEDFLDGGGSSTLTVTGFELSVDATALTSPTFDLPNITPISAASAPLTFTGIPGALYAFRDERGNAFLFSVDADGKYDYDPGFEDFLDGAGTASLVVSGFELSVDARGLPAATFDIPNITPALSSAVVQTFTGIPGVLYAFRDPTAAFTFTVDGDGLLQALPASFQGVPVTGSGTATLTVGDTGPQSCGLPYITFEYEALVTSVDASRGLLASRGVSVAVGDTITGTYTVDPAAADNDAGDPTRGIYASSGAPFGATAEVGGFTFSHDGVQVTVRDDYSVSPSDAYTREGYDVHSTGPVDGAGNVEKLYLSLNSVQSPPGLSLPPFTSDAFPFAPPEAAGFDFTQFAFEIGPGNNTGLRDKVLGTVTRIKRVVAFEFEATVSAVDDAGGLLTSNGVTAAIGDTITGRIVFDAAAPDADARAEVGVYSSSGTPYGWSVEVGGATIRNTSLTINVLDDWLQGGGAAFEEFNPTGAFLPAVGTHGFLQVQLQRIVPAASIPIGPFTSDLLPVLPPPLDDFPTRGFALTIQSGPVSARVDAEITHLCDVVPPDNDPPTANAGADQSIHAGQTVTLDGSASFDDQTASGDLGYAWSFTLRPAGSTAALIGQNTSAPTFVADQPGTYRVELVVTDGQAVASAPDVVEVSSTNLAPTADAGIDHAGPTGETVGLDGSSSSDPESDGLTYAWTLTARPAGSSAVLVGAATANPSITTDVDGAYTISLIVSDGFEDSVPDVVEVVAIAPNIYAQAQVADACEFVSGLADDSFDAMGHRKSMCNEYASIIKFLQKGQTGSALAQLDGAIERVDGCALRGEVDPKGETQPHAADYLVICVEQSEVYGLLTAARDALQ